MDAAFKASKKQSMNAFINTPDGKKFEAIYRFQVDMFAELMAVGLPITGRSTGLEGFKWGHDTDSRINKNPHPLPYIPSEVYDEKSGQFVN